MNSPEKEFDVPVIAEAECTFRGIKAKSPEEAEEIVKALWKKGERPADAKPIVTATEVGPAMEIFKPKQHLKKK